MADRFTTIFGDQIDVTALGLGLQKDVDDNLKVYVDDASIELSPDSGTEGQVRVKDLGITTAKIDNLAVTAGKIDANAVTEPKLDASNSPTSGYILTWNGSQFTWSDPATVVDAGAITESDYIVREVPTGLINNSNVTFVLANTPVVGKEMVFLNGVLQFQGAAKDYTISGATITFIKAPKTNSEVVVTYVIA
jgi:hypothetical protein